MTKKSEQRKQQLKRNIAEYRAAARAFDDVNRRQQKAGIRCETEEWNAANNRLWETEAKVPWWRR